MQLRNFPPKRHTAIVLSLLNGEAFDRVMEAGVVQEAIDENIPEDLKVA